MTFNWRGDDTLQICRGIVLYQLLMHSMTHDVAHMLPGTCCDFQQTFFLNAFQQVDKVTRFQFSYRQVSNHREYMIVHAGKQAGCVVLRPCSVAVMPLQCHMFEGFFWCGSGSFSRALLCWIDILREEFTDTITLL